MSVDTRVYPFDVAALSLTQSAVNYDYTDLFQDCEVTLEVETEQSVAARDVASATLGFEYNVPKARGYSVRLGNALGVPANGVSGRKFGWDFTLLSAGDVNLLNLFTVARVNISKTFAEARAARDRIAVSDGGLGGWRFPRVKSNRLEFDLEALVDDSPDAFEIGIGDGSGNDTVWNSTIAYSLTAGGIALTGNGALSGSRFGHSSDETKQGITLASQGLPTITETVGSAVLLKRALSNLTFGITLTRPGGTTYSGEVYIEEASLEGPEGACLQGATLRGYGPLLPA